MDGEFVESTSEKNGSNGDNQLLVNESNYKIPKELALKNKIIIIVVISLIIIGVVTAITLKEIQKDSKPKDDDIEILPPLIVEPKSDYTHWIIFLHGYDNNPEFYEHFFEENINFNKKDNTKIILMRAPVGLVTYNQKNTTSWFDLLKFPINSTDSYNFTEATRSWKMVEKVIKQEAKLLNGKYQNIFAGGHSQGACVTLYTAYNIKELIGGVLCLSGVLFPEVKIIGDKNKLKVFLGHGYRDQAIPMTFS